MKKKKDINIDLVNKRLKSDTQTYEKFTKVFTKIKEAEEKASKIRKECFQNFEDMVKISEKDNEALLELYKNFGKKMKEFENDRDINIKTLTDIIIPVTEFYPSKLKKNKNNLDEIQKAKKNTENLQKSNALPSQLNKSYNNENEKMNTFEKEFKNYEKERSEDNRLLLLRFIHSELKYHCAQLQQMSELFAKTNSKDVTAGLKPFAKEYGIEKIDLSKFISKNNAIEENVDEEEKRSDVYGETKNDKTKRDEEEESEDDNGSNDSGEESRIKKNKSTRTKNSKIGKSQTSNLDKKGKSRNIEDDED